jgi:hypothetical protein
MRLPTWLKIVWWAVMFVVASAFLYQRFGDLAQGYQYPFDFVVLLIWLALALSPIFADINIFGLRLKQEIQAVRCEVVREIGALRTDVRMGVSISNILSSSVQPLVAQPPAEASGEIRRSRMEYKILNTLWTKQAMRFKDVSQVWMFRINEPSPDFLDFRDTSTRLMREGLVRESANGQIYLTEAGFAYCKSHYQEFPPDQWWPEEKLSPERLREVLGEV